MKDKVDVPLSFITMFDEAQKQLNRQFDSSANLKRFAETIMGVSSVIVSFFATFKVFESTTTKPAVFYVLFIFIAILYAFLMILAIIVAKPFFIETPIDADLKNYGEAYAGKNEKEIIAMQINLYIKAIKLNEKALILRGQLSNTIGICLGAVVVLVLLATGSLLIR